MDLKIETSQAHAYHTQHMNPNPKNGRLNGLVLSLAHNTYDVDLQATNKKVQGYAPCSCSG